MEAGWRADGFLPCHAQGPDAHGRQPDLNGKIAYAFGTEFVEVRINKWTREIRVPRLLGAFAGGRIMNPRTAHSQLMGGLIWGMSSALLEATEIDERTARCVNDNLADYLLPANADVQSVQVRPTQPQAAGAFGGYRGVNDASPSR
jgi:xanthine dehydrogenase YagR molybdenum-binding subunit